VRIPNHFLFTLCQAGAEAALERELGRSRPDLRPAYMRPGLVTFKSEAPVRPDTPLAAVFARAYGASLGPCADAAEVVALAREAAAAAAASGKPDEKPVNAAPSRRTDRPPPGPGRGPARPGRGRGPAR